MNDALVLGMYNSADSNQFFKRPDLRFQGLYVTSITLKYTLICRHGKSNLWGLRRGDSELDRVARLGKKAVRSLVRAFITRRWGFGPNRASEKTRMKPQFLTRLMETLALQSVRHVIPADAVVCGVQYPVDLQIDPAHKILPGLSTAQPAAVTAPVCLSKLNWLIVISAGKGRTGRWASGIA